MLKSIKSAVAVLYVIERSIGDYDSESYLIGSTDSRADALHAVANLNARAIAVFALGRAASKLMAEWGAAQVKAGCPQFPARDCPDSEYEERYALIRAWQDGPRAAEEDRLYRLFGIQKNEESMTRDESSHHIREVPVGLPKVRAAWDDGDDEAVDEAAE